MWHQEPEAIPDLVHVCDGGPKNHKTQTLPDKYPRLGVCPACIESGDVLTSNLSNEIWSLGVLGITTPS
jgi:hypothetical protein